MTKPYVFRILRRTGCALLLATSFLAAPLWAQSPSGAPTPTPAEAKAPRDAYRLPWQSLHMGTVVSGQVFAADPEETKRLAGMVESEIERFEALLSVHADTPMNEVNRRAGEKVPVTDEIAEMTRKALDVAEMTGGAFDPTIGPVVNLWKIGFGGDAPPDEAALKRAAELVDYRRVRVGEEAGESYVRIDAGQNLDMGGIAKGYIGAKLAEGLRREGARRALLDLGGNVVALGSRPDGTPWRVGLQSPDASRGAHFGVLAVRDRNVITSGAYERYIEKDGKRYGHILDGRTGRPALTDIASVTIVDRDGARADGLATGLFAMGWERALAFLKTHPEVSAVILRNDLRTLFVSPELRADFTATDPELVLFGN